MSGTPEDGRDQMPAKVEHAPDEAAGDVVAEDMNRAAGRPASRATATGRGAARQASARQASARQQIGIRELRQHASVYVDLAERGYTVDITNRGRLVAQLVPANELGSPLERLIAAGIIESAEEPGGVADIEPYPAPAGGRPSTTGRPSATGQPSTTGRPSATDVLRQARKDKRG